MVDNEERDTSKSATTEIKERHTKNEDSLLEVRGRTPAGEVRDSDTKGGTNSPHMSGMNPTTPSPVKSENSSDSSASHKKEQKDTVACDITVKKEPGQPSKLSRSSSQKIVPRPAPLFHEYSNKTDEAQSTFQVITQCIYSSKYIGSTEHAMDCDCAEEWDSSVKANLACGEDSDCINRATKMECFGDCGCGSDCQNQRFQQQQFATVSVIKTEKKGYGLRADAELYANDFIFEYIGEVINEGNFRRRMVQYDEDGIKHFYFMSLNKGEFVDATKKGNLGRFCNHSCNPNCYVDKWVVGEKLRMGIFAERNIKAGEELVFNYNVDRYGADPQPCYCGEPNCTGFIGGKTQTERATKLSHTTIEALGIDDGDGWDTAVAKKPRKKKTGENDEEYVNNVESRSLDEDGVTKVMATLMQCKEKWIAVKLLGRIQRCNDERVRNRVVKMHGYQILNSSLTLWKDDANVVLQILDILNQFPRLTRNKISDSKIEGTVESLKDFEDERVESRAVALLKEWSTLEVAYRIPRKKRELNSIATPEKPDRSARRGSGRGERKGRSRSRSGSKSRSRSRSIDAPRGPAASNGPRVNPPQRNVPFYPGPRPPFRPRPVNTLPSGWFSATSGSSVYYYSASGQTTWTRPTMPAVQAQPPPPPRAISTTKALEDIINEITSAKANTPKDKTSASATPRPAVGEAKKDHKSGKDKWRAYSEEKQKKLYENTLAPHIKYVMEKFKTKLPKEDLKRFAKEISKKLVNSDYKNHRVEDPTWISSKQENHVKKYVKDFFEKAVAKKKEHDKKKAERNDNKEETTNPSPPVQDPSFKKEEEESDREQGMNMSDDEIEKKEPDSAAPTTPVDQTMNGEKLKRKRSDHNVANGFLAEDEEATPSKRLKSETPPPPPPPPPPPGGGITSGQATPLELASADDEHGILQVSPQDRNGGVSNPTPNEDLLMEDIDPPRLLSAFDILQSRSGVQDASDSAPSPTLGNPSDLTPLESESEHDSEQHQSFAGVSLERVQQLQVHDGR